MTLILAGDPRLSDDKPGDYFQIYRKVRSKQIGFASASAWEKIPALCEMQKDPGAFYCCDNASIPAYVRPFDFRSESANI